MQQLRICPACNGRGWLPKLTATLAKRGKARWQGKARIPELTPVRIWAKLACSGCSGRGLV